MHWFEDIEVVLFDLDGTLYQDESFYNRYLELLFQHTDYSSEKVQSITDEVSLIVKGGHFLKIGDWYNPENGEWIRDTDDGLFVCTWDGVPQKEHSSYTDSRQGLIYAGDVWSLVGILANRYQINESVRKGAFLQVRKEMLNQLSLEMERQVLAEAIQSLTNIRSKILLTNSPEETGREFVDTLGYLDAFDHIVYSAGKPAGVESFMRELMKREQLQAHQIVSIGDHAWNDLYPVRELGGHTVWISPYDSSDLNQWDLRISTLHELSELLQQLQLAKMAAAQK